MKTVIDLFAGVGGLSLGFRQEGFDILYANEYDKSIAESYKKNHPDTEIDTRDIRTIDFNETFLPFHGKVSVVVGGPPCQGFSQKGKRIGLDDARNYLFKQFIRVVDIVKPEFFIIENVPGILSSSEGYFKNEIFKAFNSLGYNLKAKVLKAENFGVPQTRRRAVIIGRLNAEMFEIPDGTGITHTVRDAISDLPPLLSGEGYDEMDYLTEPQNSFQEEMRRFSKKVKNHQATNHSRIALERLKMIPVGGSKKDLPEDHQTKSIFSGTWSRLNADGYARTITTRFDTPSSGQFTLPDQDRCLTVREAARLQTFPDTFVFHGTKSNQMIQVGNAVPPMLARVLASLIKKHI